MCIRDRSVSDELGGIINSHLNSKFKKSLGQVSYFLTDDDAPTNVKEFISSGCDTLDFMMSNRKNGGYPVGRITELTGLEGTGKSLLAAHALASTQRKGGLSILIDTESAVSKQFMEAIGVNTDSLLYLQMDELESIFEAIEEIITKVRDTSRDQLVTIVVDSVMGSTTKIEKESQWDKDGYATQKAIILSKAMRKITNRIAKERICLIFTNQLRINLGTSYGDPYTTSGGKAIPFHSSLRIRLKTKSKLKGKIHSKEEIVGVKAQATCFKNRIGPPHRVCDFNIFYDSGVDNDSSWLTSLTDYNIIKSAGSWKTFVSKETGEEIKFQSVEDFSEKILNVPDYKNELFDALSDKLVRKYKEFDVNELEEVDESVSVDE